MRGRHVEAELLDKPRQPWSLALGQLEHQSRERGGVDDRMLEGALQAPADEPRVESVMAVLDENGGLREAQERASCVLELGGADEHRTVDVVALARVRVDGCATVDERVEEGQGSLQREPLGADLEHEERGIAGRLDVKRDELSVIQRSLGTDLGRVDGDLVPRYGLDRPPRLEKHPVLAHRAIASARLAHAISSPSSARRRSTATT